MKASITRIIGLLVFSALIYSFSPGGYKVGDKAMDFSLINVDGNKVNLSSVADAKGYILVFTCNTCPYSKLYEQRIIQLHNKYASKGYPVIAINPNDPTRQPGDSFEKMKTLAKMKKYPFPYLVDETQEVTKAYGATRTPQVFVLNKSGKDFRVAYIGAVDDNSRSANNVREHYVEQAVEQLLNGVKVKTTETKAIGCTIKWKTS